MESNSTAGVTVTYTACTATDDVDTAPTISYSQASGTAFGLGATGATYPIATATVTCTATDASGNAGNATFDITVNAYTERDATFGTNGYVIHDAAGGGSANEDSWGITLDNDGNVIVAGYSGSGGERGIIWSYQTNGSLNTSFSDDGIWIAYDGATPFPSSDYEYVRDVAVDSNGEIVVAGRLKVGTTKFHPVLWRYGNLGTLDTSFSTDGFTYFDMSASSHPNGVEVNGVAIDSSNRIVAVVYGVNGSDINMLVWRFDASGNLDTANFCAPNGYCAITSPQSGG